MRTILIGMCLMGSIACSSGRGSNRNPQSNGLNNEDSKGTGEKALSGVFKLECEKVGGAYLEAKLTLENNTFKHEKEWFDDKKCKEKLKEESIKGKLTVGEEEDDELEVDYEYEEHELTLFAEDLVKDYKKDELYGEDKWKENKPLDITGKKEDGKKGPTDFYDLFKLKSDGDKLCLGKEPATSKKKRPKPSQCYEREDE